MNRQPRNGQQKAAAQDYVQRRMIQREAVATLRTCPVKTLCNSTETPETESTLRQKRYCTPLELAEAGSTTEILRPPTEIQ